MRKCKEAQRARTGGFVVVAVLWILAALATLATIYSVYVINTAIALTVHDERLQAEGLVTAGIELTAYQISANRESWPARGKFAFRLGDTAVTVEFFTESGASTSTSPPRICSPACSPASARRAAPPRDTPSASSPGAPRRAPPMRTKPRTIGRPGCVTSRAADRSRT